MKPVRRKTKQGEILAPSPPSKVQKFRERTKLLQEEAVAEEASQFPIPKVNKRNHVLKFLNSVTMSKNTVDNKEIIAFVLRHSADYDVDYLDHIIRSIKKNINLEVEFVCLSDIDVSKYCTWVEFQHQWDGWWSKLELFSHPYLKGKKVTYFDLDVVIVGDITEIVASHHDFTMLRGFSGKAPVNSSMMAWSGDKSFIANSFDYEKHSEEFKKPLKWGDQDFTYLALGKKVDFFQDRFPNQIVSKKMGKVDLTKNRVVCFHGKPRPRDVGWKV